MFLEIIFPIIGLSIVVYLIILIEHNKNLKAYEKKAIDLMSKYGDIRKEGQFNFLNIKDKVFQVIFFYLPNHHELTINSKHIWEVKYQFKSKLIQQNKQLSSHTHKLVIVYPSLEKIKRYINENELEFVPYNQTFYDMNVMRLSELEYFLKEV